MVKPKLKKMKKTVVEKKRPQKPQKERIVVQQAPAATSDYDSIGGKVGAFIGNGLQGLIKRVTGFGEYEIKSNTIMDKGGHPPQFLTKDGSVIVSHREYLGDIQSSVAFNIDTYPINPGMSKTFPFLSRLAQNFEEYQMKGLIFEFNSTSGDSVGTTNTALGVVIGATSYNPLAPPFSNKREMESTLFVDSVKPSRSLLHPVECDPSLNQFKNLKIRVDDSVADDLDLFDMGLFQIATAGMQASATVGELWVTYHVSLNKPRLSAPIYTPATLPFIHFRQDVPGATAHWGEVFQFTAASVTSHSLSLHSVAPAAAPVPNISIHVPVGSYLGYFACTCTGGGPDGGLTMFAPAVDNLKQFTAFASTTDIPVLIAFTFDVSVEGNYTFYPNPSVGITDVLDSMAFAIVAVNPDMPDIANPFLLKSLPGVATPDPTEELIRRVANQNPALDVNLIARLLKLRTAETPRP